jgi:hypothetical protein
MEEARARLNELLPRKIKKITDPWRPPNSHCDVLETDLKRPKAKILSNMQIYRMSMVPRSYDQKVKAGVHT